MKAGLKLKFAKCQFGVRSVEFWGHWVSSREVRLSEEHTSVFARYRESTCASELLRFIGLVGIFAEHVDHVADRMAPLYIVLEGSGWNKRKPRRRKWRFRTDEFDEGANSMRGGRTSKGRHLRF